MAIQHHPLSNAALGAYIACEHKGKLTIFMYELGEVELSCPDSSAWKWRTRLDSELNIQHSNLTEGTMFPLTEQKEQPIDTPYINPAIMDFLEENTEQSSVSPQLDKASIDGMDDMGESADYAEWCKHQDSLRSEADEASTNHLKSDCIDLIEDTNIQASYRIESEGEQ